MRLNVRVLGAEERSVDGELLDLVDDSQPP